MIEPLQLHADEYGTVVVQVDADGDIFLGQDIDQIYINPQCAEQLRDWLTAYVMERDKATVLAKHPDAELISESGRHCKTSYLVCPRVEVRSDDAKWEMVVDDGHPLYRYDYADTEADAWRAAAKCVEGVG